MIAGDGEGCTKLLEAHVTGAPDKETARLVSKSIVCSSLFKAAVFASDANWGRILCAMGYSGAKFEPDQVDIMIESRAGKLTIVKGGRGSGYSEEEATKILSENDITVTADLNNGAAEATAWGCDLTHGYVDINRI